MTSFDIRTVDTYDAFTREWDGSTDDETRLLWDLLALLRDDKVLIQLPDWLAEDKTGFVAGGTPTEFIGRIERETPKAIRLADSASARPLARLAHRIQHLEDGVESAGDDEDRREWLEGRLRAKRREFTSREETVGLRDEWLPKSQIIRAVQREDSPS